MEQAAAESGRSLAQEVEFRLEMSFRQNDGGFYRKMDLTEESITELICHGLDEAMRKYGVSIPLPKPEKPSDD